MKMLIVNPVAKTELIAVNQGGDSKRELVPAQLPDGRFALNADLLEDCGPGQTWEYYGGFVKELLVDEVDSFAVTTME